MINGYRRRNGFDNRLYEQVDQLSMALRFNTWIPFYKVVNRRFQDEGRYTGKRIQGDSSSSLNRWVSTRMT